MASPACANLKELLNKIELYGALKHEYKAAGIADVLAGAENNLKSALEDLLGLPEDQALASDEPDDLTGILALRPDGPRRLWKSLDEKVYRDKLEGAMIARFAGCTLGAIVENWSVTAMEEWAAYTGDRFPPVDYWSEAKQPSRLRYGKSRCSD